MKYQIPMLMVLLIVSTSFVGVSNTSEEFIEVNKITTELIIEGPSNGKVGVSYNYTFYLTDPEECDFYLYINWDDGTVEEWIGPYNPYEKVIVSHAWYECGTYYIWAVAKHCNETYESAAYGVTICDNHPPDKPKMAGPLTGIAGERYTYTIFTEDPDGNNISYYVDWGDGTTTGWTNYFPSGVDVAICHTWYRRGHYVVRCIAKDVYGLFSDENIIPWPGVTINEAHYDLCLFEVKGNISNSSKWQEPIFFIGKWFNKNNRYKLFLSASLLILGNTNKETLFIQDLINEDLSNVYYGSINFKIGIFIGVIDPLEDICKGFFYRATVY